MERNYQKRIELVFKEHYQEFCLLSYSYVGCTDQAQDIIQDVFLRILIKGKVNNIENLKAYAWKSVKNSSLKHLARSKKMESVEEIKLVIAEEDETQNKDLDVNIRNAMDKLPPQCKNVFELCVINGHKYDSAADSLGISKNTVKTQMKKAYRILRHNLADMYIFLLFFYFNH